MKNLERAKSAEEVGISSAEVQAMIDDMEQNKIEIHSIMLLRHGKVACEAWRAPIKPENHHVMYSISKSFLSVAYGFAFSEEKLEKKTKFLDVFPEMRPEKTDEKLEKLTLLQLLGMESGKRTSQVGTNWLESFVNAKWDFAPGESWRYVSDNYYAASAALTKILGMSINDYLTPRLYEPLGIDVPLWETSPQGIEAGGWGMYLKTEDVAKFILCCHNGGVYDGKQVIPADWLKTATSRLHDTSVSESDADSMAGYGYGFWQCAGMPHTFRCEGIYSQYAISFQDYDACLVLTGACAQIQKTLDAVWRHMPDVFISGGESSDGIKVTLPPSEPFAAAKRSALEKKINGREYKIGKARFIDRIGLPASSITMPAMFFAKEKGGDINDLSFKFDETGCYMKWSESGKYVNRLRVDMNGGFAPGKITIGELEFETATSGKWADENTLDIYIRALSAVAHRRLVFTFKNGGKRIEMYPDMIPSMDERSKVIGEKLKCILKGRYFEWWIDTLVPRVKNILQPMHHGRVKR